MYLPETFTIALLMMLTSMICWGSWANTYKLTRGYRFELFYWDYAFGIVLASLVLALTLGSFGSGGDSFLANLRTADTINIVYAVLAGIVFNVANLLLVAGIEMAGLAIAFPIAIGVALIEGVALSYAIQPTGNALLLALGIGLAVVAVILDGMAYAGLETTGRPTSRKSIGLCLVSGLLMGLFAPLVTRALTVGQPLGPYTIAVCFTLGALLCCVPVNTYFMRRPLAGSPVTFADYATAPWREHAFGLFGGVVWGIGGVFNFVAASMVGVAISYAIGQAAPMVAAAWGVFVWKEFRGAPRRSAIYLAAMFVCYLLAITVIARAYGA